MKPLDPKVPLLVRRLAGSVTLLVLVAVIVWLLAALHVPTIDASGKRKYGELAIWVAVALVATRLLDYALFDILFRLRSRVAAPALLRQLVGLLVFGACVAIVFKMVLPGIDLGGLLVSSAIITAVIGLALQGTLGNLFAGLALHLEKTVQVGDLIRSGETFGIVEELSWRAIKLHTTEGNVLLIPNSVAGSERLEVFPRFGRPIARFLRIGLEYEASPAAAREALESALAGMPGIVLEPPPVVYVRSFDSYAVTYELRYWLEDYARYLEVDSAARERVWYALHRAGIKIAYPIVEQHQYQAGPLARPSRQEAIEDVLARVDLFASLTPAERARLGSGARERRYAPGEFIVREGDRTSSMFVMESGRAAVSLHGAAGDSRRLATFEPGAAFGEISLLTGEPRTATVRALTEVTAIEIDKDTLCPLLEENPTLCEIFDAVIAERRRKATELVAATKEEMERPEEVPLPGRIARFFGLNLRA
jgi:small-conductance mechanosensitive channel/CRP-like cAMP-binding protein